MTHFVKPGRFESGIFKRPGGGTMLGVNFVKSHNVLCPFLADIACHYVSLRRSLIFLPPPSCLFPSATGEST